MAKTFAEFLNDSLHTDIEINQLDVNLESPYTAAKLLVLNESMLVENVNLVVTALKFAHQSHAALPLNSTLDNRVMFNDEYIAITRIVANDASTTKYQIDSLIDKKLRSAVLAVDNVYNKLSYKVEQLESGSIAIEFATEDAQTIATAINPTITFNIA